MNYIELTAAINDTCENTFDTADIDRFIRQTETHIYSSVQMPALRETLTGVTLTASDEYYTVPTDFLHMYSISVIDAGVHSVLLNKDVNFIREAYPTPDTEGVPRFYAYADQTQIMVGPTPDSNYPLEINYGRYPASIVDANTSWLGEEFDTALLNGCLVEAARFLKEEQDIIQHYQGLYTLSIGLLKNLADGKLREDAYRSGQVKIQVS